VIAIRTTIHPSLHLRWLRDNRDSRRHFRLALPHWNNRFCPSGLPESKQLSYYAERFDIVELNNTFYKLPTEAPVLRWKETSPPEFHFAVKGSRYLTHVKKLKDLDVGLERFFARVDLLGSKLGPVLFQLPPHWEIDCARLRGFLKALPRGNRYAFEFRDPSWHNESVYKVLEEVKAAYCIFDLAGFQSPMPLTADFTYIRLHGSGAMYEDSYQESRLRSWAKRLREWGLTAVYIFFDND